MGTLCLIKTGRAPFRKARWLPLKYVKSHSIPLTRCSRESSLSTPSIDKNSHQTLFAPLSLSH